MDLRQVYLFDQEVRSEAGRTATTPSRRVAAAAVFKNPLAGQGAVDDMVAIAELSLEIGHLLTKRARRARTAQADRLRQGGHRRHRR